MADYAIPSDADELFPDSEGVIESISYRNDGASWIVSSFVVGDGDDESKAECEEHLRSCMDPASGA